MSDNSSSTNAASRQDLVAVLIGVHAGADADHLDDALASMRAQTYAAIRLMVYADGPLTQSQETILARHLRVAPGRDLLIRGEGPKGLPTGLNALIDASLSDPRVEFMARMDADDVSVPERIDRQVEYMREHPDVDVVGTWCIEFTEPGVPTFHKQLPSEAAHVRHFMLYRSPLAHPTVMFRREVFEAGARYSASHKIMQDYELWSRLLQSGHVISNVPEYLLWFRMADGFYSRRAGWQRAIGEFSMRLRYAKSARLLRPQHLLGLTALFVIRMSPDIVKRLAYKYLR